MPTRTFPLSRPTSRRDFFILAGSGTAALLSARLCAQQRAATPGKPNFVFVLSDDQDWTGLSVQMHDAIPNSKSDFYRTPNLEELARQAMRFSSAYAPAPVCSPTRYSLLTGKSPAQLQWTKASPVMTAADGYKLIPPTIIKQISANELTIAEVLKQAGYATAHFGKWHLRGGGPGRHGFDEHDGDTGNKDAAPFTDPNPVDIFGITERAGAFMAKHTEEGRPFYCQLSHHALHYSQNALEATKEAYRNRPPGRMHNNVETAAITENLDAGVGVLMDKIEQLGIADNTYLIYMSDNGAGGRSRMRPLSGGKGSLWEGGIRVPLLIRGPGVEAGDVLPRAGRWLRPVPDVLRAGGCEPRASRGSRGRQHKAAAEQRGHG